MIMDKAPGFILTQFGFNKDNVARPHQGAGRPHGGDAGRRGVAPSFLLYCLSANVGGVVEKKLATEPRRRGTIWAMAG